MNTHAKEVIVDLLGRGHAVQFHARGESMWPSIQSNDVLHVEPTRPTSIARGDVILALTERGLTAHRVIRIRRISDGSLRFTTRGDNVRGPDDPFHESRLLGRVTHAERDGRPQRVGRASRVMVTIRRLGLRFVSSLPWA